MAMRDAAAIPFGKVYPMYVHKVERKGRTKGELDQVIRWLTGYDTKALAKQAASGNDFRAFFDQAPALNPKRSLVTGVICGVRIEDLDDPAVKAVRQLDKLVDELAKGRPMEKVLREQPARSPVLALGPEPGARLG
jgi:hypothetical protein